jgi:hypothetical protein
VIRRKRERRTEQSKATEKSNVALAIAVSAAVLILVLTSNSQYEPLNRVTTSDLDQTWEALRKAKSDFGSLNKKVATLRALSPYTKKYGRTG